MERLTKKSIALKIAIVVVFVLLFNFSAPTISQAGVAEVIGGTLLSPIIDLLLAIGDGAVNLIQSILFGIENSLLKVAVHEADLWETIGMVVGAVAGIAAVIAITVVTGGAALSAIIPALVAAGAGAYAGYKIVTAMLPDTFYLPVYAISPEEIFSNKIGLLDVNFFNPDQSKYEDLTLESGETVSQELTSIRLQPTISSWYLTLRNLALVVLLSVLLYIGIRIVTSTAAQDKAKYKEKLSSWIIAMCILFFMHYIMAFATMVVGAISEGINTINKPIIVTMPNLEDEDYEVEVIETNDEGKAETKGVKAREWFETAGLIVGGDEYAWPTNLMGRLRLSMQMDANLTEDNQTLRQLGYVVLFLVLVFYTIAFLVVYIKRLIMLAFLTMIAPLVAMTYPLDKMNDGNAQAFNMWLKEYVFNLLIQPLHLILYTMLVGSAIEFASENMIYAIVAIGFIFEAEKILRRFFGFDKASTVDANGSAVGGALAMAGVNQLRRLAGAGKRGRSGNGSGGGSGSGDGATAASNRKIKTREMLNQLTGRGAQSGTGTQNPRLSTRDTGETQPQLTASENSNGKSDEWNRLQSERQALDDMKLEYGDGSADAETYAQLERDINESDTRGIRTWASDLYQGSRLQSGVNGVTNAVGTGLHNAANYVSRSAPVRMARQLGANAKSVKDMAVGKAIAGANTIRTAIPKPIRNSARTLGGHMVEGAKAAGNVAKGVGAVGMEGLKYAAPRVGKGLAKGGLAVAAGTMGVAAGLATGDDKNVLQYGAAGAAAGWAAGSGAVGTAKSADDMVKQIGKTAASTYTVAAHGVDAEKERQRAAEDRAAMKDKDRQKLYQEELQLSSKKEVKQAMEDAQQYREQGITDDVMIIKAMKAKGFGNERASQERILLAGLASETGNDNKKIKDLESRLTDRGLDARDVKKYVDGVREITGAI